MDLVTDFDIINRFKEESLEPLQQERLATQRTLTPPDTWSYPIAFALILSPFSPELVSGLRISNIPRYFYFACNNLWHEQTEDLLYFIDILAVKILFHILKKCFITRFLLSLCRQEIYNLVLLLPCKIRQQGNGYCLNYGVSSGFCRKVEFDPYRSFHIPTRL